MQLNGCRDRGFTLIELLVVIAIIAIILGILLPALGSARDSARVAKCLSNAKQTALSMTLYADANRSWYPVVPRLANADRNILDGQGRYGGLAGFFSLYQEGTESGKPGYQGFPPGPGRGAYADGNKEPLMRDYVDSYGALTCPADKLDIYYGTVTPEFAAPPYSIDREVAPVTPANEQQIVSYNISYMYIAGLKTDEPEVIEPAPIWGDETLGPDVSTQSFYGDGREGDRVKWGVERGYYAKADNHGNRGGNWVFTDGHAEFLVGEIHETFFDADARSPKSINSVNRFRSRKVQTVD